MARKRKRLGTSTKLALLPVIHRYAGTPMLVVGDLMLDHYIWGRVERISPEAPVVVVRVTREEKGLGGACNTAKNLVALGAQVRVCGVVGSDEAGCEILGQLRALGVDCRGVIVDERRQTTVKSRVIAHAQQVVRVDREETEPLTAEVSAKLGAAVAEALKDARGVVVSDYAKAAICAETLLPLYEAWERGLVGYGKIPLLIDPKAPNFGLYRYATVIKPNRAEAQSASGMEIRDRTQGIIAASKLLERWPADMLLLTLGEDGMVLVPKLAELGAPMEVETVAQQVYDVSGAGDTVSAIFSLSLAVGGHPKIAAELANHGAGIAVAQVGTVAVSAEELAEAVEGL